MRRALVTLIALLITVRAFPEIGVAPKKLGSKHIVPLSSSVKSKESYKDIIQKAQNLTLSQEREQATQILLRAIESESLNKKATEELLKTLHEVSTIFYTEKSQRLYEYAKTLFREAPAEALEKFQECLAIEPSNVQTLLQQAQLYLFLGKCEESEATVLRALKLNPFSKESQLLNLQSKACSQKNIELEKDLALLPSPTKQIQLYLHTVLSQHFYNKGDYLRAQVELQKATALDSNYPEIYYWESLVLKKLNSPASQPALRYIRLCKTFTKKDYKKYDLEPRVCQEYKNFETEYKADIDEEKETDYKEDKRDI